MAQIINNQSNKLDALLRELETIRHSLKRQILFENISNKAMQEALEKDHPDEEIQCFLESIGQALQVDRIYIFEDAFLADETSNTYEWCNDDVNPEINNLQKVPRSAVTWWYDQFEKGEDILIPDLEAIRKTEPTTYSYLNPQGIHALIAKRIFLGGKVIGFFGVDNPSVESMDDISSFLDTISNFISSLIRNRNIFRTHETRYVEELERKNVELNEALHAAKEANKAKTRFLSNMSHDIRTPMNAIIGMADIANNHIDDKQRVLDCLHKITISGRHLLGLINDVLDMAKIESGKMTLREDKASLRDVIDTICGITRVHIKEKAQHFDVVSGDILCEDVYCDSLRLNQVLLNLLSNAIKYTKEDGSIELKIWQEASEKGDGYVRTHLSVADNGIGMSPEFLCTIFDAFTRADVGRVQQTQGTGLGMAITKSIVDTMKGSIEVESELDHGSTFHVVFDLRKAATATQKMQLPPWNILVVDDNEEVCLSVARSLQELGTRPQWCTDGRTALKKVSEANQRGEDFYVVLVDYRMPVMNGVETAKKIYELLGDKTPIEMISAYDFSEIEDEAKDAHVSGFISKPLFLSGIYQELCRFIPDYSEKRNEDSKNDNQNLRGVRILLAEDNDINAEIAMVILEEIGIKAERAEDGERAVELFTESVPGTYGAILMDLRMPHMDGLEATAAIRALKREDAATIPIIAMTADAFAEDVQKCLDAGMNAHLAKPIDIDQLKKTLTEYFKN